MNYFEVTTRPSELPIVEREAWHRDEWCAEQAELAELVGIRQYTLEQMTAEVFDAIYRPTNA